MDDTSSITRIRYSKKALFPTFEKLSEGKRRKKMRGNYVCWVSYISSVTKAAFDPKRITHKNEKN